jgi:uncharacterized protein (DUF58 family)
MNPEHVAETVRRLEMNVDRRIDGRLHGHHRGITPGQGSEPGDTRLYQPGDDVRRIDWSVTARTSQVHVRDQIADRDLQAWLVVDASAGMRFGTTTVDKFTVATGVAAAVGFLTARHQNRVGTVVVAGSDVQVTPPRPGRDQVRAIVGRLVAMGAPTPAPSGASALASALERLAATERRRGFVAVIADLLTPGWTRPLGVLGQRHDVLVVEVLDPRELELTALGQVTFTDPATGRRREVRITPAVCRRYAEAARAQRDEHRRNVLATGADHLVVSTADDWLAAVVNHVQRRRTQVLHPRLSHPGTPAL